MMSGKLVLPLVALGVCASTHAVSAQELVSPALTSNMVVQADQPVRLWGMAEPGQKVTIAYSDRKQEVVAASNASGHWMAELPARKAGEKFEISVSSGAAKKETLRNLIAGDVWLCSGQSNMDLAVGDAANASQVEARASRYPIRIAKVRRASVPAATSSLAYDIGWQDASDENVGEFSSACWHMGEEIADRTNRPLGLIHSAWGGTTIEDWISAKSLARIDGYGEALSLLNAYAADPKAAVASAATMTEQWVARVSPENSSQSAFAKPSTNIADWPVIELPQMWEQAGVEPLSNYNGIVWFARDFVLTKSQAAGPLVLDLERIDERDAVWVNGQLVGSEVDPNQKRKYSVPANLLREGTNRIAIRVIDERGSGGFRARADRFLARASGGEAVSLSGPWHYQLGAEIKRIGAAPPIPWKAPRGSTTLYNGMIGPLGPMPMKGVAWYQGESNSGAKLAPVYHELLKTMIADWRASFNQPQLPFVIAQLPGFGKYVSTPKASNWAELREAQRAAVSDTPNTGLAVLIDSGEADDIHPRHKLLAGKRLASTALRVAYSDLSQPVAPYPTGVSKEANSIVVSYASDANLEVVSGVDPNSFQLCTAKNKCRFVRAELAGNRIKIQDPAVDEIEVRYAWEDTPIVNLFSSDGFPAAPFSIRW